MKRNKIVMVGGGSVQWTRNIVKDMLLTDGINNSDVVLNYTNPMTTLTTVLARLYPGPVVGLCHGLFENLEFLKHYFKLDLEEDMSIRYAGLNHFFWITEALANGKDLPAGTVLETAVVVDRNGFAPITFGELPACVAGLVEPFCLSFNLCVEACFRGDKQMALQALRLDPVCAHLTRARVQEMGNQLLYAHRAFLPDKWR